MAYNCILNRIEDGVSVITFNRPEKLCAMNAEMMGETTDAIDKAVADENVRCILLTGTGRGFCSGQDLNDRIQAEDGQKRDLGVTLDQGYNRFARKIHTLRMPMVVAVNGIAAGAGASIALLGDIVVAAKSASFMQAFVRIGLVPDCGGTYALPRLAGRARALGMTLLGDPIDAETAADWGLIWKIAEDDALLDDSMEIAKRLAAGPTKSYALIRQAIRAADTNSFDEQLDFEMQCQRAAGYTDDHAEGVQAFLDKRDAEFKGR
ncbi:MAG: 2-(1,2-epoxy-1,2-dihydrophenyl)acetyl-CoA isomerase [Rhodospirillaceae bacterium]|nr:2-(1,2-epoxy-1,2-dihydrophenyl)acetyl-CoA isomerase [Rhodospirillaceae bacterium]